MDIAAVLADFDEQMRRRPPPDPAAALEFDARVTRYVSDEQDWNGVVWSDLGDADADAVIAEQVRRFGADHGSWEWKLYSHDRPADLADRLRRAGFVAEPTEALLVAALADVAREAPMPAGVTLVAVADGESADALEVVHREVFGAARPGLGRAVLAQVRARPATGAAVVAFADGQPVAAGRLEMPAGRPFASLWGGGTVPAWRERGLFTALVAWRAAVAAQRGYRYLQVDALPTSRPILERLGWVHLADTTPFRFDPRPPTAGSGPGDGPA